jgi:hypothetical protein
MKVGGIRTPFQSCSRSILELEAQEKEEKKALEEKFQPLLKYLKTHSGEVVRDGEPFRKRRRLRD